MISVVIPTFNRDQYLAQALNSLAGQNYRNNFEVLIIDDGSVDRTKKIAEDFKDKLNLKYFHQKHLGVSRARNLGIEKVAGEIIAFFDDDAIADHDWLQNIESAMKDEMAITGRVAPIKNNIWQYFAPHYNQGDKIVDSPVMLEGNAAVKKTVFEQIGSFDDNLDYGHEGEEFIGRLKSKFSIKYYPDVLIYHDYAFGFWNYLAKQKKFGDKMAYLKINEIKNPADLFFNYKKLKQRDESARILEKNFVRQNPALTQKFLIKIIAKIGALSHFFGAVGGYFKYKNIK